MALFRSCSVRREAELLLKFCSSIFLFSFLFFSSSGHLFHRDRTVTEFRWHYFPPFPLTQPPLASVHPPLIWWWLGRARAWVWTWIAMGCETDSQSRLECLSPAWSSLQEGTKGALQGSAGWISSKEPMAGLLAGWLAGWLEDGLLWPQQWVTA